MHVSKVQLKHRALLMRLPAAFEKTVRNKSREPGGLNRRVVKPFQRASASNVDIVAMGKDSFAEITEDEIGSFKSTVVGGTKLEACDK